MDQSDQRKRITPWWAIGFVWNVFFSIALPTVLFALGGRWIDRRLETTPWFTVIGLILSMIVVVLLVRRQARRLQDIARSMCH